jgi:hypothetical protein
MEVAPDNVSLHCENICGIPRERSDNQQRENPSNAKEKPASAALTRSLAAKAVLASEKQLPLRGLDSV